MAFALGALTLASCSDKPAPDALDGGDDMDSGLGVVDTGVPDVTMSDIADGSDLGDSEPGVDTFDTPFDSDSDSYSYSDSDSDSDSDSEAVDCVAGTKSCGSLCQPTDIAHGCRSVACDPCPSTNGIATCSASGACELTCSDGFKKCGGLCVAIADPTYGCGVATCDSSSCPSPGLATLACSGSACVLGGCGAGAKKCGSVCVPTDAVHGCAQAARCTPCDAKEACIGSPTACTCVSDGTACSGKCGVVKDSCGKDVTCPGCTLPEVCGGKIANVCGERCVAALELLPKDPTVPTSTYTKLTVLATYGNGKKEALSYESAPGNQVRFIGGESACDARIGCYYPVANTIFINTYEVMNGSTPGTNAYAVRISGREVCGSERVFSTVTSAVTTFTRVAGLLPTSMTANPTAVNLSSGDSFGSVVTATFTTGTGVAEHNVSYIGVGPNGTNGCGSTLTSDRDLGFGQSFSWTNSAGVGCLALVGSTVGGLVGCGGGRMAMEWRHESPFRAGTTTVTYGLGARSALQTIAVSAKVVALVTLAGWKSGGSLVDGGGNIPVGIKPRMRVNVAYVDGTTDNEDSLSTSVVFTSSDATKIAFTTTTPPGVGEALAPGKTNITAMVGGVRSADMAYTVSSAKLCEIRAVAAGAPAENQMVKNSSKSVNILGSYRDSCPEGTFRGDLDIAGDVTGSSENPSVVAVKTAASGTTLTSFGTAAAAPGIKLKFSKDGVDGSLQTSGLPGSGVGMIVQNAEGCINAVNITNTDSSLSLPHGAPIAVAIDCSFTGTPVPCIVNRYTSSAAGFLANLPGSTYTATGGGSIATGASGSTNISAIVTTNTCAGTVSSPIRTVTLTTASLVGIVLTPNTASIAKGASQQYRVDANYSDGSTFDVTKAIATAGANRLFTARFGVVGSFQNGARAVGSIAGSTTLRADYTDGSSSRSSAFATLKVLP